jgi:hypothetical protein
VSVRLRVTGQNTRDCLGGLVDRNVTSDDLIRLEPGGRLVRHLCHVLQVVAVSYCGRPVGR